jgi:prepilin-type processing-associated H-X9-DG protein
MLDATTRRQRLARVLRRVRVPAGTPVLLASDSNDTWRIGSVVLRICWRGDRDRFAREAAVTAALPPAVPYPEVLETDRDEHLAWQVTRAVDGVPLALTLPALSATQRRNAVRDTGRILAALNAHPFPADVNALLAAPRPAGAASVEALIGADLNPLPCWRALLLTGPARALPHVDPALIDDVEARLRALTDVDPLSATAGDPAVVPRTAPTCVHGDAHPSNILWLDGHVAALLDFEWARLGPPDLELEPYLRGDPDAGKDAEAATRDTLGWLAETHPAAFAHPDLIARLWLYQLAFTLRQLLIWVPDRPAADLPGDHPMWRLRRIVDGPKHLHRLIPDAER